MISLAIPGVVLGLSYVLFYKGSFLYGGIAILVLVNITHFFANPYLMAYNSLQQFHSNLEDISTAMGISRFRMLKDVYIPCTKGTIVEMFSYLFYGDDIRSILSGQFSQHAAFAADTAV